MARAGWNLTFSFRDTEPVSKLILVKFPSGVGITRWGNSNLCSSSLKPILFQSKVGSWRSKLIIHDLYLTFNLQVLIVRSLRSRKLTSCVFKRANYQNMKLWISLKLKTLNVSQRIKMFPFYFIFGFTALNKWKYLSNICHFCCITNSSSCTAPSLTPQNRISAHFGSIQSVAWFPKRMQMCLDSSLMLNLQRIQFIRQQGAGCWAMGTRISWMR